jgi:hypothetical protein
VIKGIYQALSGGNVDDPVYRRMQPVREAGKKEILS